MKEFTKWVACFGNATSISDQQIAMYAKDVTLRYPIKMCFDGSKLRFRFSNLTGTEPVFLQARVSDGVKGSGITLRGNSVIEIAPGKEVCSDELNFEVKKGKEINVSIYLKDYTQMNSGTLITGPLSKGFYSYGNHLEKDNLLGELTRPTNWYYFINTIDVFTEEKNKALICYGDSITAQDWPDYLQLKLEENGINNVAVIRRAVSGTRILREYSCITYAAYGLKGAKRFPIEVNTSGAEAIIIQHGINDIIHPVGVEVNEFRPMSDLPTAKEMEDGIENIYVKPARKLGLKVYSGTLLPILGWRTYAEFRENLKNEFNDWLRNSEIFDGCIDFDKAVRDEEDNRKFKEGFDSGDHLHPSKKAYMAMADAVLATEGLF